MCQPPDAGAQPGVQTSEHGPRAARRAGRASKHGPPRRLCAPPNRRSRRARRARRTIALGDRDPPCSEIPRSRRGAICCGGSLRPPQERPASVGCFRGHTLSALVALQLCVRKEGICRAGRGIGLRLLLVGGHPVIRYGVPRFTRGRESIGSLRLARVDGRNRGGETTLGPRLRTTTSERPPTPSGAVPSPVNQA